jgi:hypothetical protein
MCVKTTPMREKAAFGRPCLAKLGADQCDFGTK